MKKQQLVELCKKGDRNAFDILYQTRSSKMMKVIRRYVNDSAAAEDIMHDGFIIILSQIIKLKDANSLDSWMTAIMKNLSFKYIESSLKNIPLDDIDEEPLSKESDLEDLLSQQELDMLINRLPEGYRTVFRLSVLQNLSHKEIGAILGIAPHSSSSQLSHAKTLLRKLIANYRLISGFILLLPLSIIIIYILLQTKRQPIINHERISAKNATTSLNNIKNNNYKSENISHHQPIIKTSIDSVCKIDSVITKTDSAEITPLQNAINKTKAPKKILSGFDEIISSDSIVIDNAVRLQNTNHNWAISIYGNLTQHNSIGDARSTTGNNPDYSDPSNSYHITDIKQRVPLNLSIAVSRTLNKKLSIESGLNYTLSCTDIRYENSRYVINHAIKVHSIGLPVKIRYSLINNENWHIYGSIGTVFNFPIKTISHFDSKIITDDIFNDSVHSKPYISVTGGIGFEYSLTPKIGIYAEPSIQYNLSPNSSSFLHRKDNQFIFTLPIGIRFNLQI